MSDKYCVNCVHCEEIKDKTTQMIYKGTHKCIRNGVIREYTCLVTGKEKLEPLPVLICEAEREEDPSYQKCGYSAQFYKEKTTCM